MHNAGQTYDTLAMMLDQGKAETAMQVNFWSFTRLAGALVRPMIRARDGRIVAIGSVTALQANQGNSVYAACKAALLGYLRTLAVETAQARRHRELRRARLHRHRHARALCEIPRADGEADPGRPLRNPDDVAAIVPFLLSPGASYITGAVLPVDGGLGAAIGIHR